MRRLLLALPLALGLGGCETVALNAIESYELAHEALKSRIIENNDWRREIRFRCREMVIKEADALESQGDFAGARAILAQAYPPLITVQTAKSLANDPAELSARTSGCN